MCYSRLWAIVVTKLSHSSITLIHCLQSGSLRSIFIYDLLLKRGILFWRQLSRTEMSCDLTLTLKSNLWSHHRPLDHPWKKATWTLSHDYFIKLLFPRSRTGFKQGLRHLRRAGDLWCMPALISLPSFPVSSLLSAYLINANMHPPKKPFMTCFHKRPGPVTTRMLSSVAKILPAWIAQWFSVSIKCSVSFSLKCRLHCSFDLMPLLSDII